MRPTSGSCSSACAPSAARAASRATACSCRRRSRSRRPSRRCWPSIPRRSRRLASRASPSARARSSCARCRGCSAGATWGRWCGPWPASWWRRGPAPPPSGPPTRRSPPSPATAWCASDSGSARRKRRPDSRQIYRDLDVGTAKPTTAERARVPHHCLDLVAPDEAFDAARFRDAARAAIADIARRGRVALVVGGTGLYVRALLRGLCPAPPRAPALRAALAAEDAPALHRRLGVLDPAAAARIAPTDARRIVRALEVALVSGLPLSGWQAEHRFAEPAYDALVIGLARPTAELDARIAARTRAMLEGGFLDEVRALRRRGLGAEAPGLSAVGYRELLACVEGRTDLATALAAVVRATRQFAKRQRTWFRREPAIVWHHPEREAGPIAAAVEAFLAGAAPAVRAPA